jgi:hypothetical protein
MNLLDNPRDAILFWAAVSYALNLYIVGHDIYHNQVPALGDGLETEDAAHYIQNIVPYEVSFVSVFATLTCFLSICKAGMHSVIPICVLNISEIIFMLYNEGIHFVGTPFFGVLAPDQN